MGGGGGLGLFTGTAGSREMDALSGGTLVAANGGTVTDAGSGKLSSEATLPQSVRDAARLLERPLDFAGGERLQRIGLPHEQFVFDTGENFGKMSDGGIRADDPKNMNKYTQVDPRIFKGKYIREAQRELAAERQKVEEMYEKIKELPLSDNMPHRIPAYNVFIDNCLVYSGNVIRRAKQRAKDAGDTLTY